MNLVMKQVDTLKGLTALAKDIEKRIRQLERDFFESPENLNQIIEIIGQQFEEILIYISCINTKDKDVSDNLLGYININERCMIYNRNYVYDLLDDVNLSETIFENFTDAKICDLTDLTIKIENIYKIQLTQTVMVAGPDFDYEEQIVAIEDYLYLGKIFETIIRDHIGPIWQIYREDLQMQLPHFMDPI